MWGESAESLQMTDCSQSDGWRLRIHLAGTLKNKYKKKDLRKTRQKQRGGGGKRKGIVYNLFLT